MQIACASWSWPPLHAVCRVLAGCPSCLVDSWQTTCAPLITLAYCLCRAPHLASPACRVQSRADPRLMHQQGPWLHTAADLHCHHVQSPAVQQQRRRCYATVKSNHCSADLTSSLFVILQSAGHFPIELLCTAQSLQRSGQDVAATGQVHCFRKKCKTCTQLPVSSFPLSRCCRSCLRPGHTGPNHTLCGSSVHQPDPAEQYLLREPTCSGIPDGPLCM